MKSNKIHNSTIFFCRWAKKKKGVYLISLQLWGLERDLTLLFDAHWKPRNHSYFSIVIISL